MVTEGREQQLGRTREVGPAERAGGDLYVQRAATSRFLGGDYFCECAESGSEGAQTGHRAP